MIGHKEYDSVVCKAIFFKSLQETPNLVVCVGGSSIVALPQ